MATTNQYEFFKYLFEIEKSTQKEIVTKGQVYLSVITFYLGVTLFKAPELLKELESEEPNTIMGVFLVGILFFLFALLFDLISLGHFYKYERINDAKHIINQLGKSPPSDEDFFDDRIIDLTVAITRNTRANRKKDKFLLLTTIFLIIGVLFHSIFFTIFFIEKL